MKIIILFAISLLVLTLTISMIRDPLSTIVGIALGLILSAPIVVFMIRKIRTPAESRTTMYLPASSEMIDITPSDVT